MPDVAMHYFFGQDVLTELPADIRIDPDVFVFALSGPDDWFFCFTNLLICARGRYMHRRKTGAFLKALAQKPSLFSYFCGYYCHYILDATCHPYIIAHAGSYDMTEQTRQYRGNHTALERALDRWIMDERMETRHLSEVVFSEPLPEELSLPIDLVYQNVFGWTNVFQDLLMAKKKMRRYTRILEDRNGFAKLVTDIVHHPLLQPLPYSRHYYETEDILNLSHRQWHHPKDPSLISTSSFPELLEQARKEAVAGITAVSHGDLSLIGNRSYLTGLDLDDKRNDNEETYSLLDKDGKKEKSTPEE